jgi:phage tail-like protein
MPERQEVFRNYGFALQFEGGPILGYFTKVSGLGFKVESIEHREGGMPSTVRKLVGRTSVNDIELSRGVVTADELWEWLHNAAAGKVERRSVSILVLDADGQTTLRQWSLSGAWISEYEVAPFDALSNEVLIERMKLVAETLERAAGAAA